MDIYTAFYYLNLLVWLENSTKNNKFYPADALIS